MPTAVVVVDKHGAVKLINTQAEKLLNFNRADLIGKPIEILVPMRFRQHHRDVSANFIAKPAARPMGAGRDLSAQRKDGSEVPVEIGLHPILIEGDTFTLATIVDLTERKRANEDLRRANLALVRSNQDLQRFAYVASHDLQSPLRNIAGFVQLLQLEYAGRLDSQADEWIRRTVKSIEQLQTSIRDLLAYSQVDSTTERLQTISMQDVVDDTLRAHENSLREVNATVVTAEMPIVSGDFSQLLQLLQNLIANAVKYRGADTPRLHITAQRGKNEWVFAVRDNGIGIDEKFTERIFEIFYRLHTAQAYPGTGIGLAICRRIVERHGGRIWVESKLGVGSIFYFTLPDKTAKENYDLLSA